jgi:hypothetical protein
MANGNFAPKRVIEGQATKIARTIHVMAYDEVHDEIITSNPQAGAILVFRGAATGNEAPIRVIQGPKTELVLPHAVSVDPKNGEIIVSDPRRRSVLVFAREANGDVAPLRIIDGPKTGLQYIVGTAVDTVNDLLIVSTSPSGRRRSPVEGEPELITGLAIFNRTDNGDVAPRAIISGPKTGIQSTPWQLQVYQGKIFAAISNDLYRPLYSNLKPRPNLGPDTPITSPWGSERVGFIGVWKTTDNGNVPPLAVIRGPGTGLIHSGGVALSARHKEIYAVDSVHNGLFTFLVPNFFSEAK